MDAGTRPETVSERVVLCVGVTEAGGMEIVKLCGIGTRPDAAEPMVAFVRDVLGLRPAPLGADFWMASLPDGGKVEIFGPRSEHNRHFGAGSCGRP